MKGNGVMKHWQWLLTKIAEEASELSQIALKTQQFGLFEVRTGQEDSNLVRMAKEYNDLLAHISMLNSYLEKNFGVSISSDFGLQEAKKEKATQYLQYSVMKGCVESMCVEKEKE